MRKLFTFLTILIILIPVSQARTLRVPSQYPTIQAGIDASVNGDTVLVADGLYVGLGNRDLDFNGRAVTLISENGPDSCVIDCELSGRGFYFHSFEDTTSTVKGFTIVNGYHINGGGIFITNSSPYISNSVIKDCCYFLAGLGGGIYVGSGAPRIVNCTIVYNDVPSGMGGGIYSASSDIRVNSCIIAFNSALGS